MAKEESRSQHPRFKPVFITSLLLVLSSVIGLVALFVFTVPTLGPRWLLFFLVAMLASGLALPVVYYLNLRFPSNPPVSSRVISREAAWCGIYADLLLWLQFGKVLNYALAIFIAIGFIAIELLLRMREQSSFSPRKTG